MNRYHAFVYGECFQANDIETIHRIIHMYELSDRRNMRAHSYTIIDKIDAIRNDIASIHAYPIDQLDHEIINYRNDLIDVLHQLRKIR